MALQEVAVLVAKGLEFVLPSLSVGILRIKKGQALLVEPNVAKVAAYRLVAIGLSELAPIDLRVRYTPILGLLGH